LQSDPGAAITASPASGRLQGFHSTQTQAAYRRSGFSHDNLRDRSTRTASAS